MLDRIKTGDSNNEFIDKVSLMFASSFDDPDHVHETMMSLSEEQFRLLCLKHFEIMKRILSVFKNHIISQSWTFNYTDSIGRQCYNLYYAIQSFELRAILIYIIIEVGSSHNRWHVMDLARNILKTIKDDDEAFEVASSIQPLSHYVSGLNIKKSDLHIKLQ